MVRRVRLLDFGGPGKKKAPHGASLDVKNEK
jgi:hypothetical protein